MKQSSLHLIKKQSPQGLHVAIIMDGNGRWAQARGMQRTDGHRAGAEALRRTIEAAPGCGVTTLTVYAFSSDNWKRPESEISELMKLFRLHLLKAAHRGVSEGVKVSVIGRRDRLPGAVQMAIATAEGITRKGENLHLRIAVDYSSRDALIKAVNKLRHQEITRDNLAEKLNEDVLAPDVDLLIRTSGEQRLSDFLLWECAYSELYFTKVLWPDFGSRDLAEAVNSFQSRDRRFGGIEAVKAG